MSIQTTGRDVDIVDNTIRQLGEVGIISDYQEQYFSRILSGFRQVTQLFRSIAANPAATIFGDSTASTIEYLVAILGSDVPLTAVNTFFDGPSITCSPGTWWLLGVAAVNTTTNVNPNSIQTTKLWDGVTVFASAESHTNNPKTLSTVVSSFVFPTTLTSYKISVASDTINTTTINAATTTLPSGNNATYLLALKLA